MVWQFKRRLILKTYYFYDTDILGNEEYNLEGEQYQTFLDICFAYCATMSFRVCNYLTDPVELPPELEKYRIPVTENVIDVYYQHYGHRKSCYTDTAGTYEIRHYALCARSKEIIRNIAPDLFSWVCGMGYHNPDDPAFYRADGSVFFWSVIHEGKCALQVNDNEDVRAIISNPLWIGP